MQAISKKPKHNKIKIVVYLAIVSLFLITAAFSTIGNMKFKQLLLASCNSVKKGINSINIPTGSWQCSPRQTYADFNINNPFNKAGKGRFWYDRPKNQWLMWGSSNEPEADFVINVAWKKTPDQYTGNLRQNLRRMKRFRYGNVTVASSYKSIGVHQDMFEILPFIYQDQTMAKKCLGFTNKQRDNRVMIRGWFCARPQTTPGIEKLECILSSLAIDGILEQDRSTNWCSNSRQQLQS